jgi:hypothetical protein
MSSQLRLIMRAFGRGIVYRTGKNYPREIIPGIEIYCVGGGVAEDLRPFSEYFNLSNSEPYISASLALSCTNPPC